jgi:hypothetical protein
VLFPPLLQPAAIGEIVVGLELNLGLIDGDERLAAGQILRYES